MTESETLHLLSILMLANDELRAEAVGSLSDLQPADVQTVSALAAAHHVVVRALGNSRMDTDVPTFTDLVKAERARAHHASVLIWQVCDELEKNGCPVTVIKSFDHWPDFGSDVDLLTMSDRSKVVQLMCDRFGASIDDPSWSDRLARKINFRLPNLAELVEIHFGHLGQAGEQTRLSGRILQNRIHQDFNGLRFWVPSAEDRILLATLQRLYRHFYFRICDIANTRISLNSSQINFDELRRAAKRSGIWPGVATFLRLCSEYVHHYSGEHLKLPRRVWLASSFGLERVYSNSGLLRLPLFPQSVSLYVRQLLRAIRRRDPASSLRLGLVPPLALAANVKFKTAGEKDGIW